MVEALHPVLVLGVDAVSAHLCASCRFPHPHSLIALGFAGCRLIGSSRAKSSTYKDWSVLVRLAACSYSLSEATVTDVPSLILPAGSRLPASTFTPFNQPDCSCATHIAGSSVHCLYLIADTLDAAMKDILYVSPPSLSTPVRRPRF